jgi:hypothetical protein
MIPIGKLQLESSVIKLGIAKGNPLLAADKHKSPAQFQEKVLDMPD